MSTACARVRHTDRVARAIVAATCIGCTDCGARTGLVCPTLPADAAYADAPRTDDVAPRDGGRCTATLRVDSTDAPLGCVIDLRVGHMATLEFPCGGGAASVSFADDGSETFVGTVASDGSLTLSLDTMFRPGDGCLWVSHQTIAGTLSGAIQYTYTEMPAAGQSGCLPPCPVSRAVIAVGDAGADTDATASATRTPAGCE